MKKFIPAIYAVVLLGIGIGLALLIRSTSQKAQQPLLPTKSNLTDSELLRLKARKDQLLAENARLIREANHQTNSQSSVIRGTIPSKVLKVKILDGEHRASSELAQVLELTPSEKESLSLLFHDTWGAMMNFRLEKAELQNITPSKVTIQFPSFKEEGKQLQQKLFSSVDSIVGSDRGQLFREFVANSVLDSSQVLNIAGFNRIGEDDTSVSINAVIDKLGDKFYVFRTEYKIDSHQISSIQKIQISTIQKILNQEKFRGSWAPQIFESYKTLPEWEKEQVNSPQEP
jgi:hypothetical protein